MVPQSLYGIEEFSLYLLVSGIAGMWKLLKPEDLEVTIEWGHIIQDYVVFVLTSEWYHWNRTS